MAQTVVPWVPLWAYAAWVARGVDWLAMTEDLPRPDNRVTVDAAGRIRLRYRPDNARTHRRLVREMRRILRRLGFWAVMTHSHGARNTTHPVRDGVLRHRSADLRARSVLPLARRREPVRRRCVVLSVLGRG